MSRIIQCAECGAKNRVSFPPKGKAVCGKCKAALPVQSGGAPLELNDATFDKVISQSEQPVLVDFWASWCGPCKTMAPVLSQFQASQGKITIAKLNTEENRIIPQRFNIMSIPTMILFVNGKEARRVSGAMPMHALRSELAPWL